MSLAMKKNDKHFTYGDYIKWPEDKKRELIYGIAYDMSPAPLPRK